VCCRRHGIYWFNVHVRTALQVEIPPIDLLIGQVRPDLRERKKKAYFRFRTRIKAPRSCSIFFCSSMML
jgi:hypothetical protein